MRKIGKSLFLLSFSFSVFSQGLQTNLNEKVIIGRDNVTKEIVFEDGTGTPAKIQVSGGEILTNTNLAVNGELSSTGQISTTDGTITLGDGTNKDVGLSASLGGKTPFLKYDSTSNAWVKSDDGTLIKKLGTGSGGSNGINFIKNNSFEDPGAPILNWSNSGGTLTQESHTNGRENNEKFARFVATTSGQYFESDEIIISDDVGPGCMADMKYMQGDNAFKYEVIKFPYSYPNDVVSSASVSELQSFYKAPTIVFSCSGGDKYKFRFTSTGAGTIDVDGEVYLGGNKGFISSESLVKTISYTPVFNEFGTTSEIDFTYMHIGDKLHIQGRFKSGTLASLSEAKVYLPSGFTAKFSDSFNKPVGIYFRHTSNASNGGSIIAVDGKNYLAFSASGVFNNSAIDPSSVTSSGGMMNNNEAITLDVIVPVGQSAQGTTEALTPEQANFFISASIGGGNATASTAGIPNNASLNMVLNKGSAKITCSDGSQGSLTCATGNEQIGIEKNLPRSGLYKVCFNSGVQVASGGQSFSRIAHTQNLSDTVISLGSDVGSSYNLSSETVIINNNPCGIFDISSSGINTFKLYTESGDITTAVYLMDRSATDNKRDGHWTIEMLSHNGSNPIILNMVDTKAKNGASKGSCHIIGEAGTPIFDSSDPDCWFIESVSPNTSGIYNISFTSSGFKCSGNILEGAKTLGFSLPNTGRIASFALPKNIAALVYDHAGSLTNSNFSINCSINK